MIKNSFWFIYLGNVCGFLVCEFVGWVSKYLSLCKSNNGFFGNR